MSGRGDSGSSFSKVNQSLYFARLHCDMARALAEQTESKPQFLRQQQLGSLEAAVDCLYRAVYFLALFLLAKDPLRSQLQVSPERLLAVLVTAVEQNPAAEIQSLLYALKDPDALALMLDARRGIWSDKPGGSMASAALNANEISLVDASLSLDSCEQWMAQIAKLAEQCRASNAEY